MSGNIVSTKSSSSTEWQETPSSRPRLIHELFEAEIAEAESLFPDVIRGTYLVGELEF